MKCPICDSVLTNHVVGPKGWILAIGYDCPNCGHYIALEHLQQSRNRKSRAVLSHFIWQRQGSGGDIVVTDAQVEAAENARLPHPLEQVNLLTLFLGVAQDGLLGKDIAFETKNLRAKVAATSKEDVEFIIEAARQGGLVAGKILGGNGFLGRLTLNGWIHFAELQKGQNESRTAFMAMPFGNGLVNRALEHAFRPAVNETGFVLKLVIDDLKAGLIDDRIRVGILTSRFVIADLTDSNAGAYWEAGYAHGLKKEVIYTCEKSYFDEKKTHFDTNHHQTVIWEVDKPEQAKENLKATIRATLPLEARMQDDEKRP